ncbi:apolipoprotein C-I [Paralichthys olivaceus]|uniref:apolipoprotein C-I n=1 Tax=Paralichthys olivaceus TaxID=8255 RepID=UPI00375129F3
MKLFLAVAVLMLALVAYTEAQDDSIGDTFTRFGDKMQEMGRDLADRAKTTFEEISSSEAAVKTKNWFTETFEGIKNRFQ